MQAVGSMARRRFENYGALACKNAVFLQYLHIPLQSKYGYSYEAASLLVAMNGNADNGILRSRWIEFSQESLAQVARSVARGVHAVSPETIVGLQHPNFHRELLEGYDWTPVLKPLKTRRVRPRHPVRAAVLR